MKSQLLTLQLQKTVSTMDEMEKMKWSRSVIEDHLDTSVMIDKVLKKTKKTKRNMEKSLNESRQILDSWKDYSDKYQTAVKKLANRIEVADEEDRLLQLKQQEKENKIKHTARLTRSIMVKRRSKFVSKPKIGVWSN